MKEQRYEKNQRATKQEIEWNKFRKKLGVKIGERNSQLFKQIKDMAYYQVYHQNLSPNDLKDMAFNKEDELQLLIRQYKELDGLVAEA